MRYLLTHILVLITIWALGANIPKNSYEPWMDSVIAEGVTKINKPVTSLDDYTIIIDVANYLAQDPGYSVNLQNNKWYYEVNGVGSTNVDISLENPVSLENQLNEFNSSRTDNIRLYSIFIKNIPFRIKNKVAELNPDTNQTLSQQLNTLIVKNPRDYSELQAIYSLLINSIKQQSNKDAIIYGVGHFYTQYGKEKKKQGFLCNYFTCKTTGPLANAQLTASLRTIVNAQKRNFPIGDVKAHISGVLAIIKDNIKCAIDNNCGDLQFPVQLAGSSFFNDIITNRNPSLDTSITFNQSTAELHNYSGITDIQDINLIVNGWITACNKAGYKLQMFLTDRNTNNNVLRQINTYSNAVPSKTIFFWIHEKADGKKYAVFNLADDVVKNFDKYVIIKALNDYMTQVQLTIDLPGKACEGIADWMHETIMVPAKYYDKNQPEYNPIMFRIYMASCEGTAGSCYNAYQTVIVPNLGLTGGLLPEVEFAFACGLWNGLVGQVQGVFELMSILGQQNKRTEFWNNFKQIFNSFSDTWSSIKQQFESNYLDGNNVTLTAYNIGKLIVDIASCFIGLGEIKALVTTGKLTIEIAHFAKMMKWFAKGFINVGKGLVKIGQYTVRFATTAGKIVITELKKGEQLINNILDVVTGPVNWDGSQLMVKMPDGSSASLRYIEDVYDSGNNNVGKFYQYSNNNEPLIIGSNQESAIKAGTSGNLSWLDNYSAAFKNRISQLDNVARDAFKTDFEGNATMMGKFNTDLNWVDSWEVLYGAGRTNLRSDLTTLTKVKEVLGNNNVSSFLGATKKKALTDICSAYGGFNVGVKSLANYLEDVKVFATKFSSKGGASDVLMAMKNPNGHVQDGLQHMLNQVNQLDQTKVLKFDGEFEIPGVECTKCKFDVEMVSGNSPKYIEYKSYDLSSIPNISIRQFKEYLRSTNSFGEFVYVFNKQKITDIILIKAEFQKIIKNNSDDLFNVNPNIFINNGIPNSTVLYTLAEQGTLTNTQILNFIQVQ